MDAVDAVDASREGEREMSGGESTLVDGLNAPVTPFQTDFAFSRWCLRRWARKMRFC